VRSSKRLTLYRLTSHPQNLCRHNNNLIKACLAFPCFESWLSLVRERNITVIWKTISEAVVGLNLLCPKSFQKQFGAFFKALEFQTICSHKTYAAELRMFGRCLFVCFQSPWSQVRERNISEAVLSLKLFYPVSNVCSSKCLNFFAAAKTYATFLR